MNREEFEQFVMNCGKDILRFCRLTAGGRETGDELYQDTMLALLEKGARLDPVQNTKSYALSVAILLGKNKKRKYANRRRLVPVDSMERMEEENGLDPPDDSAASPDEYLLREDERRTVQKIVAELRGYVSAGNSGYHEDPGGDSQKSHEQGEKPAEKRIGGVGI